MLSWVEDGNFFITLGPDCISYRALDKREYLMIIEGYFFLFLIETKCCDLSSELSR